MRWGSRARAAATSGFGKFGGDVLIGNHGSTGIAAGRIHAFGSHGELLGELSSPNGKPVTIDGLWALSFGTFAASDSDSLYFTAGPNDGIDGLFGSLTAVAPSIK